jgi:hypothetical protein
LLLLQSIRTSPHTYTLAIAAWSETCPARPSFDVPRAPPGAAFPPKYKVTISLMELHLCRQKRNSFCGKLERRESGTRLFVRLFCVLPRDIHPLLQPKQFIVKNVIRKLRADLGLESSIHRRLLQGAVSKEKCHEATGTDSSQNCIPLPERSGELAFFLCSLRASESRVRPSQDLK